MLGTVRVFSRLKRTKPVALEYPRLALYRSILRAHQQYLPADARKLGDAYVKTEFGLHRDASDNFMGQFNRQWRDYLTTLRTMDPEKALGRELLPDEVAGMSDEQKVCMNASVLVFRCTALTLVACVRCSGAAGAAVEDSRKCRRCAKGRYAVTRVVALCLLGSQTRPKRARSERATWMPLSWPRLCEWVRE